MTNQHINVFISHIHEDDVGLAKVRTLLSNNGMTIRDGSINSSNPNNAESEAYIKGQILAPRIQACGVMLVYITPGTKDSDYVNWEIEYAHKLGKRIVGIWAHGEHGCEAPQALKDYGDKVVGWHGNSIIDAINGTDSGWEEPNGTPISPQDIQRYSC